MITRLIELEITGSEKMDLLLVPDILRMASKKAENTFLVWIPDDETERCVEVTEACFERLRALLTPSSGGAQGSGPAE